MDTTTLIILLAAGGVTLYIVAKARQPKPQPNYTDATATLAKIFAMF